MKRVPSPLLAPIVALALCLASALPASPQEGALRAASSFMDSGHWTEDAVRRMAALGVIDGSSALQAGPIPLGEIASYLEAADQRERTTIGAAQTPPLSDLFAEEFPVAEDSGPSGSMRLRGGWSGNRGGLFGGAAVRDPGGAWRYPGPSSAGETLGERLGLDADLAWGRVHGSFNAEHSASGARIHNAYLGVSAGSVDLWFGREAPRFGPGRMGVVVLDSEPTMIGAGVRTRRALNMPGPLSFLGTVRGTVVLSRMARSGSVDAPWFTAARLTLSPNPSVVIGLNRAAIFGGAGNVENVSVANIALMTLGVTGYLGKDSGFENQVASVDVWARSTLGDVPYAVYGELGLDDVGLRIWGAPAVIAGVEVPELPGLERLGLGIEYARFFGSCCGKPPWYRHGDLGEGWTDRGRLLGHPLGGHGSQLGLNWSTWPMGPLTHLGGSVFVRHRGGENLFFPDWRDGSFGGSVRGVVRAAGAVRVRGAAAVERGRGDWQVWTVELAAEVSFGRS